MTAPDDAGGVKDLLVLSEFVQVQLTVAFDSNAAALTALTKSVDRRCALLFGGARIAASIQLVSEADFKALCDELDRLGELYAPYWAASRVAEAAAPGSAG